MYYSLTGTIVYQMEPSTIIMEVSGVGYEIHADSDLYSQSGEAIAYVYFVPSEDEHRLYGFTKREKRELFKLLKAVSGIGPKTAMKIISHTDPVEMITAIISEDIDFLCSLPGIGKRTAERLMLELQNKRKELQKVSEIPESAEAEDISLFHQSLEGLEALGYPSQQARKTLRTLMSQRSEWKVETLIKAALKSFLDAGPNNG